MNKTTSIAFGMVCLLIAFILFCTDNMVGAVIGTAFLFASLLLIRYGDSMQTTQDERRHHTNHNK